MRTRAAPVSLLALWLAAPTYAADPPSAALKKTLDDVLDRPEFESAFWGVEVRSLATGKVLYARNAEKHLRPASTLKLVTTAAALDAFGPEDRIRTTVETAARQDGMGRLLGDVYLVGRGDPNLSGRFANARATAAFEEMAERLGAAGVKRIEGRVVGNEALFRGERRGEDWSWGDLVWWYGAEVSALSFNDNCVDLKAAPGERVGDPIVLDREPRSSYATVVAAATTAPAGAKEDLTLTRAAGGNLIRVSGTLPLGAAPATMNVAVEDPARYAATVFKEVLEARGILVAGGVATSSDPLPAGARVIAFHDGPPLAEVLKGVNKPSQNLHAEMLLRLLGARAKGDGTVEGGAAVVADFLSRIGVAPTRGARQDGSGLASSDLVTAHDLVTLLAAMAAHRHARVFEDSLPIAGVDGTLRNRLKGTAAEGRLHAKTGSVRHVNAVAGYADRADGARLAFAAIVNNQSQSAWAAMDAIALALFQ